MLTKEQLLQDLDELIKILDTEEQSKDQKKDSGHYFNLSEKLVLFLRNFYELVQSKQQTGQTIEFTPDQMLKIKRVGAERPEIFYQHWLKKEVVVPTQQASSGKEEKNPAESAQPFNSTELSKNLDLIEQTMKTAILGYKNNPNNHHPEVISSHKTIILQLMLQLKNSQFHNVLIPKYLGIVRYAVDNLVPQMLETLLIAAPDHCFGEICYIRGSLTLVDVQLEEIAKVLDNYIVTEGAKKSFQSQLIIRTPASKNPPFQAVLPQQQGSNSGAPFSSNNAGETKSSNAHGIPNSPHSQAALAASISSPITGSGAKKTIR